MSHKTFDPHGVSDAARQGLLDNRCEKKPKNHRTLGRRKRLAKAKRDRVKAENARKYAMASKYMGEVRAYWRGERADHPVNPFTNVQPPAGE